MSAKLDNKTYIIEILQLFILIVFLQLSYVTEQLKWKVLVLLQIVISYTVFQILMEKQCNQYTKKSY